MKSSTQKLNRKLNTTILSSNYHHFTNFYNKRIVSLIIELDELKTNVEIANVILINLL